MLPLLLKAFFVVMVLTVVSLMLFYAGRLTRRGKVAEIPAGAFWIWVGALVAVSIGFHAATTKYVPWVAWELRRGSIEPDREIAVGIREHAFNLEEPSLDLYENEVIRFRVRSEDLTYGFGVFRDDGTMEFQMQVVPGHDNDIVWTFSEPGRYSIRSTEYAGPRTPEMFMKDAILVAAGPRPGPEVARQ